MKLKYVLGFNVPYNIYLINVYLFGLRIANFVMNFLVYLANGQTTCRLTTRGWTLRQKTKNIAQIGFSNQKGVFSPFMFGMLMAIGVFSVLSMHWAKQDLVKMQLARAKRIQAEGEDIAKAIEFSILTETAATYSQGININKIRQHTSLSQGKTRGGDTIQIVTRDSGKNFNLINQRIAISAADDPLQQSELNRSTNATDLARKAAENSLNPTVVVDTGAIRQRQVLTSKNKLNGMTEQVYQFFAGNLRFPNPSEYEELAKALGAKDVWGTPFSYTYLNEEEAILEFTTPWNYTYTTKISLKEE